jgi:hypothetical protein
LKRLLLWVSGVVLVVFGAVGVRVFVEGVRSGESEGAVLDIVIAVCLLVLGVLCLVAARRWHQLRRGIFFGALLMFFGMTIAAVGVDDVLSGGGQGVASTWVLAGVFVAFGLLLIVVRSRRAG